MRFVYRTRKDGLLPENTRPKAQSKPGSRGTANLFVAIHRGRILLYPQTSHGTRNLNVSFEYEL